MGKGALLGLIGIVVIGVGISVYFVGSSAVVRCALASPVPERFSGFTDDTASKVSAIAATTSEAALTTGRRRQENDEEKTTTTVALNLVFPRIFVYDIHVDFNALAAGEKKFMSKFSDLTWAQQSARPRFLDSAYNSLMRNSRHRTYDPANADYFYIPVERGKWVHVLVEWKKKMKCPLCDRLEEEFIKRMRKVGKYWDMQRSRHIVAAANCPEKGSKELGSKNIWFPMFYGQKTLMLCVNADKESIDHSRAIQSIYFVSNDYLASAPLSQERDYLAAFMGAVIQVKSNPWWHLRRTLLDGMENCTDCIGIELPQHVPPDKQTQTRWRQALPRARFHIIPPGDSLERSARDQSIAAGVIPVIFDFKSGKKQILPMSPPLAWSSFSVNFTLTKDEWPGRKDFWPRLEAHLRSLVESGDAQRLLTNVVAVQTRLMWTQEGIFQTLMDMLDRRRGLLV